VGTFWALEVGLQILFKVFEDIGYSFRVLQPIEQLMSLTGTERIDNGTELGKLLLVHRKPPKVWVRFCNSSTRSTFYENIAGALFLMRHATNAGTYSQFRGEVQRFLNYIWVIRQKSLREIGGDDVDGYMEFVKNRPPARLYQQARCQAGQPKVAPIL